MVIGIAGGSGSGKTTFARKLLQVIGEERCTIFEQDSYYFDQSKQFQEDPHSVNFDDPASIDFKFMIEQLCELKNQKNIRSPVYDFKTHTQAKETREILAKPVILVDGILIYCNSNFVKEIDMKFFLDTPEPVRFERRLRRDIRERARTEKEVTQQFYSQVKIMHDRYVEPSKKFADYIIRT